MTVDILALCLILEEKLSAFHHKYISCKLVVDALKETVLVLIWEFLSWMDIGFCQIFFLCVKKHKIWSHYISSIFSLACWYGLHCLIFNIEPALHIWNKAHLSIFLFFYILLDLLIFGWRFFHLSSWERMVCSFHFFLCLVWVSGLTKSVEKCFFFFFLEETIKLVLILWIL